MTASGIPSFDRLSDAAPHARLLSNGRYSVVLTAAGTGYSAWGETQLTAWEGDRTQDGDGVFVYLRDLDGGRVWSAGRQPTPRATTQSAARYTPACVTLQRRVADIESSLRVCVAPDADLEVRQLTLTNHGDQPHRIEVTAYAELVLNGRAAHNAHPAFSKLFVETEHDAASGALLARRRPRSHDENPPWMASALLGEGELQVETDRARFVGRNRSLAAPRALSDTVPLSGSIGSVLDPVFALRRVIVVAPGREACLHLLLAAGVDRTATLAAIATVSASGALQTVFERAAAAERERAAALHIDDATAAAYQELGGALLYGHPALRAAAAVLARAHGSAAQIWQYALGGAPLMALRADRADQLGGIAEWLTGRTYWGRLGLRVDAAVLCGPDVDPAAVTALAPAETAGTLFVRRESELPPGDVDVLLASAHLAPASGVRRLAAALAWEGGEREKKASTLSATTPTRRRRRAAARRDRLPRSAEVLQFDNGVGGFSADGTEYVLRVDATRRPPLAWVNVIANQHFGFLVSESGAAHTWSRNSHEQRLTPWYNDPIRDPHGEAFYVRDDASGEFWSPQPGPAPADAAYDVRHGFGYSTWRLHSHGFDQEVVAFVPPHHPLRIARLRLRNDGARARRVSVFSYQRLVLGTLAGDSGRFIVTEHDGAAHMLLARNRVNGDFSGGEVFAAAVGNRATAIAWTCDRRSFIGRDGSPAAPRGVAESATLDGSSGAALDGCFALQATYEIPAGGHVECAFLFGEAADRDAAAQLVQRYRSAADIDAGLAAARQFWRDTLTCVQVETPVPAVDLMANGWLLYQVLSCRLWGRAALYQSGGAFGFRDQLQDCAALVYSHPELSRAQILLHAAHQFVEGDVLHWWHPPADRGTRTRFSDDLLWLPYIACYYAGVTGDWSVFDESAGFLTAPLLAPGQDEAYLLPSRASETGDVYDHCCRAIDRSLTTGAHGLPLMGSGDWNDGMNRVGREGRGESVWLGFFLYDLLADFVPLCERRGDSARAGAYGAYRTALGVALNDGGWDGVWYRRAYYDDGAPLGSAQNLECKIDVLAQAWAVMSGAAPPERAARAMEAVDRQLVDRDAGLIHLLWPPFDRDPHDPGYIKGYVPGIRENGGQYTHGATWALRAFAELGRRDRAAAYLEMLSPVSHTGTPERLAVYQVEPYVLVADVYGVEPHLGRGGWTWYTGAAGWMYRVALESVLGVRIEAGTTLVVAPCIPDQWPGFRVRLRLPGDATQYEVAVENPGRTSARVASVTADGKAAQVESGSARVPLVRDGGRHDVRIVLGAG